MRKFKEQVKGIISFENVTCDRERRKKTKEKMLNVLTNRKRTPPPETSMNDLTPCKDNEKSNISSDKSYPNSNNKMFYVMVITIHTIKFLGLVVTLIFQICLRPLRKMIRRYFVEQKH